MPLYQQDPVHQHDGSWWFFNTTLQGRYGPYPSEQDARLKLSDYIKYVKQQMAQANADMGEPATTEPAPVAGELEQAVAAFAALREQLAGLETEMKERAAPIKERIARVEGYLLNQINTLGVKSFRAAGQLIYTETKVMPQLGDKGALLDHIRKSGEVELLQTRVSSTVLKEWSEAHNGALPPGVTIQTERVIRIRKG